MSKYPYLGVNELDQSRHAQPCSKKQKATQTVQKPHTLLFTPCIIFTFKSHQQFLHCFAIFLFILFCQSLFLLCFFFLRSILAVSSHFVVFLLLFFFLLEPWKESSVHPKAPWSTQSYSTLHTYILCKHGRHLHLISRNLLFPWCSFFSILPPSTLFSAGLPNTHTHTETTTCAPTQTAAQVWPQLFFMLQVPLFLPHPAQLYWKVVKILFPVSFSHYIFFYVHLTQPTPAVVETNSLNFIVFKGCWHL